MQTALDLHESREAKPLTRHGDQLSVPPDTEIAAELDGPRRERAGLCACDEGQHVRNVLRTEHIGIDRIGWSLHLVDHLHTLEADFQVPVVGNLDVGPEQHRDPAGADQGRELAPVRWRRLVGQGREWGDLRIEPLRPRPALRERPMRSLQRVPHRVVQHVHGRTIVTVVESGDAATPALRSCHGA